MRAQARCIPRPVYSSHALGARRHPADVRVRRLEIARPAAPKASPRPAALLSSMGYPA
jgi:hypothetical protein